MRILALIILCLTLCTSPLEAEEDLQGFIVTPESAEFALYDNLLSPSSLNIDLSCVGKRIIFTEELGGEKYTYVCQFNCNSTDFEWQIISEKPWIIFKPQRGKGKDLSHIRITVDSEYLKNIVPDSCNEVPCFKSDVTFRINYYLDNCYAYSQNGSFSTSVTYYEELPLKDFVRVYYSVAGLSPQINPDEVIFHGETNNSVIEFNPAKVYVLASHQDWDYESSAPWLSLTKNSQNPIQGFLEVLPVDIKEAGRYRGYVRIKDRATGRYTLLQTTIDLKGKPGEAKFFYALFPDSFYKDLIEVNSSQWFEMKIYLGPNVNPEPLYVEITHSAFPDYIFAYHWKNGNPIFSVASYQGIPITDIDKLYYADHGIEKIHIGPFRLAYLPGTAHIRLKQGFSWSSSKPLLDLELIIHSLAGIWKIVDLHKDREYEHPYLLEIQEGTSGLSANWGNYNPKIQYGSDPSILYEILFRARDFIFRYQITQHEGNYLSGVWSYSTDGFIFSEEQPFYGIRIIP
jgi:hypothetical protein